jgi:hypothetical protein
MVLHRRPALPLVLVAVLAFGLPACGGDDNGGGGDGDRGSTGAVTDLSVAYEYSGPDCGLVGNRLAGTLKKPVSVTNRQFTIRAFGGASVFEGRFNSPTETSGRGHFEPPAQNKPGCKAANITWDARP